MNLIDYKLVGINTVSFEDFFNLINANKSYIEKGFAGTVKRCATEETAKVLYNEWVLDETKNKGFSFFIKNIKTQHLVGLINIKNIDTLVKKCEIGYFISKQTTSKGIVTNLTKDVVTFCFETLQMNKVFLRVFPENIASQKVALKNGFVKEGILREEYLGYNNNYEDVMYLGLLKSDYLKLKND